MAGPDGPGRGGLYTYEWIENLLGAKIHNLDRIDPGLQRLEPGEHIRLTPEVYLGRIPGQFYVVKQIVPAHALVMLQELPTGGLSSWSFTQSERRNIRAATWCVGARPRQLASAER